MSAQGTVAGIGRVVLVGPLPPPIDGCSYANQVLVRNFGEGMLVIDTSARTISGAQGDVFSLRKAVHFLSAYLQVWRVALGRCVYITPGQTFFGFLKYAPFMLVALLLRRPYVIHIHGNHLGAGYRLLNGFRRWLFASFVKRAAAGVVLSESLRRNFDGLLSQERVFVVENFAGDDLYKEQMAKPQDVLKVLYLSNLMREKGILDLLDALVLLEKRGVPFEATIAGQLEEGICREVNSRLGLLGRNVKYVGSVTGKDKVDALRAANVLVLPTYYSMEGQPISLLEGLATGNILVTTKHAGIPDVIDASNGFIVPIRDCEAIANALSVIASDLEHHINKYSMHNVQYAQSRFTEHEFAIKLRRIFTHVIRAFPG